MNLLCLIHRARKLGEIAVAAPGSGLWDLTYKAVGLLTFEVQAITDLQAVVDGKKAAAALSREASQLQKLARGCGGAKRCHFLETKRKP